jgi:hypothetical protein
LAKGRAGGTFSDIPFPVESDPEESSMIVITLLFKACWEDGAS